MKVTFILPPVHLSGGIKVAFTYAEELTRLGHVVTVVSPPQRKMKLKEKIKSLFLNSRELPEKISDHLRINGCGFKHQVLNRYRPVTNADVPDADVVIATWWETAEWVNKLDRCKGAKVYFVQGHEVFDFLPLERCKATYAMPLHKIVISNWLKNIMCNNYGDMDVDLVPNAVDHSQFHAVVRGKADAPTLGFLYHRGNFKGVDTALRAISALRLLITDLRVISFGAYPLASDDELLSGGKIEYQRLPNQNALRDIYASCDVWLTASRSEGFNLPAMEAMACRTPVVSTKTGWPEEAIVNGVNGYLVDVDDVDGLTEAVRLILMLSDAEWRTMSEHAFETVKDASWRHAAKLFEKAINNAIERG